MKGFKKLALASAICSAPVAATAMEAIEDEALSEVTGQDGITINASVNLSNMNVRIEDDDGVLNGTGGVTNAQYTNSGVLMLNNLDVSTSMTVDIDSGGSVGDSTGNGMLNVFITTTANTVMGIDSVQVADSDGAGNWGAGSNVITFAAGTTVTVSSGMTVDVELGNEENNFATINGSIGTVAIGSYNTATGNGDNTDDLTIVDGGAGLNNLTGGSIFIDYIQITGIDLVNAHANVVAGGLTINTGQGLTNVGMTMLDVKIGTANSADIGDIYVSGLDMSSNVITISGH